MQIASLFAGAGGLDLGFKQAGFDVAWANEYDKSIHKTFQTNFPDAVFDGRDIRDVPSDDIPDVDGVVGGPPCQSWSEAGAQRGIDDDRGKLFFEYVRVLKDKQPLFFLAENVQGMLFKKNADAMASILADFYNAGYDVNYKLLNAVDYGVPQDRKRVIFVGFRSDLGIEFDFPAPNERRLTLRDAIYDIQDDAVSAGDLSPHKPVALNHEYWTGDYSSMYMSRNRVRTWDEPSFTIQASGRHAPIHPQANVMVKLSRDSFEFDKNSEKPYRRLSVRECARVQTFPDDFEFIYNRIADGYKMVGNAVPVAFAKALALQIKGYLKP